MRELGFYFAEVDTYVEDLNDNKVDITYNIELGEKSRIKKISFLEIKYLKTENSGVNYMKNINFGNFPVKNFSMKKL